MVEINNLTRSQIDKKFLREVAKKVLKGENEFKTSRIHFLRSLGNPNPAKAGSDFSRSLKNRKKGNLSIVIVSGEKIQKLNKKYRKKDKPTDVLSFPRSDKFPVTPQSEIGEVVICLPEVKKNAKNFNLIFQKELARVLIHGILHLLGYEHEKNKTQAQKMRKREEYYMSKVNFILW